MIVVTISLKYILYFGGAFMAKTLIIVESPAKVKTISKFLGRQYTVRSSVGHIRDLPKSQIGVDVENKFSPKYITIRGKGDLIKELKDAAKKADKVLLATDPDREGEAISWHLSKILNIEDQDCRISFNEITESAVKNAITNPRRLNMALVDAQQARRVLDRLVGYNLSPLLWRKVRRGLSAGRVQSSALKIICDREKEIQAFIEEEYWTIDAFLKQNKGTGSKFSARLISNDELSLKNEKIIDQILKNLDNTEYIVNNIVKKERKRNPSPPFTTSTLQQEAFRKLNFPARKTMQIAQQLYEGVEVKGDGHVALITYMRTDSVRISKEAQSNALSYIASNYGEDFIPNTPRSFKGKSSAQDAHEAIRPVSVYRTPDSLSSSLGRDQLRLYKLIWERFMASQMSSAVLDTVSVDIKAGEYLFRATGSTVKFPGFTILYTEGKDDNSKDTEQKIPDLSEGEILKLIKIEPEQHFTQPPPRYSEATLVKTLEENGIGRPSTYAPIIDILKKREYAELEQRRFIPTEIGFVVYDMLNTYFPTIVDLAFTAQIEDKLDDVGDGKAEWVDVVGNVYNPFSELLKVADEAIEKVEIKDEPLDEPCPQCGTNLVIKNGRFGKFIACPNYPECKYTRSIVKQLDSVCPLCQKPMIERKSRRGRKFYGCSGYPECEFTMWNMPSDVKCTECGSITIEKKLRSGKTYKCQNPKCEHEWQLGGTVKKTKKTDLTKEKKSKEKAKTTVKSKTVKAVKEKSKGTTSRSKKTVSGGEKNGQ